MTEHDGYFRADGELNHPGALIAALPAVLGFVPEKSLVLAAIEDGALGAVLRVDLGEDLAGEVHRLADVLAGGHCDAVIAVIVDADGAHCPVCNTEFRTLAAALAAALADAELALLAVHVVDRVQRGGRWHCVDGCGAEGVVEDPQVSAMAAAAVFGGRRLYDRRADLAAVVAAGDRARSARLAQRIGAPADDRCTQDPDASRRGVHAVIAAARRLAAGIEPDDDVLADIGGVLTDVLARDTLFALAVGDLAAEAESLWALLARALPEPSRVEALALLAFSAYARGDGPLAGVALQEAVRCDPAHRMAGMLDEALQSGMRPEQIRELARTGYRVAEQLGVRLPPRLPRRAG